MRLRKRRLGIVAVPSLLLSPEPHPSGVTGLSPQFDMQRITLEELKHILYHAFRDHLTMKDIENIIINEEESLNENSGNCQTEFEGERESPWGSVQLSSSCVCKTCSDPGQGCVELAGSYFGAQGSLLCLSKADPFPDTRMKCRGLSPLSGGMQAEGCAECLSQAESPHRNTLISIISPWKGFLSTGRPSQAVLGSSNFLFKPQKGSQGAAGMSPLLPCDTSSEQRSCPAALGTFCSELPGPA